MVSISSVAVFRCCICFDFISTNGADRIYELPSLPLILPHTFSFVQNENIDKNIYTVTNGVIKITFYS